MNQNNKLMSVVVPTFNRNHLLSKCLDKLSPAIQSIDSEYYEVIVTDDGLESSAEFMINEKYPWARWVEGPHKGPAANRNNGANHAKGKWLIFTDDDCLPDANLLNEYQQAINHNKDVFAFEGAIHPLGNPNQDLAECPINTEGGCFWSANIAVKKELFDRVGGFDENYSMPAHEDQDLLIWIKQYSAVNFIKTAKVFHPVRIVPLNVAISRVIKRSESWAYHVTKNSKYLGYKNGLHAYLDGFKFQLNIFINSLMSASFRNSIVALAFICIGLPMISKKMLLKKWDH